MAARRQERQGGRAPGLYPCASRGGCRAHPDALAALLFLLVFTFFSFFSVRAMALEPALILNASPQGQSLSGHLALLHDADGTLDISEVADPAAAGRFAPLPGNLAAGYSGATHWLRFTLRREAGEDAQRLLELLPTYLDEIRLYEADAQGGFRERRQGDVLPRAMREAEYRGFVFRLSVPEGETTYYLRLRTTSTTLLVASLWLPEAHVGAVQREYLAFGVANGVILAAALFALLLWAYLREPLIGHFALLALLQLAGVLTVQGFVGEYFLHERPELVGILTGVLIGVGTAQVFLFFDRFLEAPRRYPRLSRYYRVCVVIGLVTAISAPLGLYVYFAPLLMLAGIGANTAAYWPCRDRWRAGGLGNLVEMSGLLFYVGVSTFHLAALLGLAPASLWVLNANALATLLYLGLFEFSVLLRIGEANRRRLSAEAEARQERTQREDQARFLAMLAHELRTPISIVAAATQSLETLDARPDEQRGKRYARIGRAVRRMDDLLHGFLAEERIHGNGWLAQVERVSLAAQTRAALDELGLSDRVCLRIEDEDELPSVQGDRLLLQVVLRNLIENARKYALSETPIDIALKAREEVEGPGVEWRISDRGAGIPPPLVERIFEKYYRASESSGTPGFGLGLYLSRRIVERHGGRLSLDTGWTSGASFVCWLPCEWDGLKGTRRGE